MLIALLALLGVNLIVLVVFAALVVGRRRWLKRQPGEFTGAVRVCRGEIDSLSQHWKRGSGRWVRDVLVWNKGPFMYRTDLVPVDAASGERQADKGEVKRLGERPAVIELAAGDAKIEIAARAEQRDLVIGPFAAPALSASAP
jgi:hypothetical protein